MTDTDAQFQEIIKEVNKKEQAEQQTEPKESVASVDAATNNNPEPTQSNALVYPHIKIMQEENLTKDALPKNIRDMIITFNRKLTMAKRNNSAPETFLKIQNLSTLIADKLMDFLEKDIPKTQSEMKENTTEQTQKSTQPIKKEDGGAAKINAIPEPQNSSEDIDHTPATETASAQTETPPAESANNETPQQDTPQTEEVKEEEEDEGLFGGILGGIFNWK